MSRDEFNRFISFIEKKVGLSYSACELNRLWLLLSSYDLKVIENELLDKADTFDLLPSSYAVKKRIQFLHRKHLIKPLPKFRETTPEERERFKNAKKLL